MTDDRPLPEYGEYATPEQQAAAMGREYVSPEQLAAEHAIGDQTMSQVTVVRPAGFANRLATALLLGLGVFNLVGKLPSYFSYASSFKGQVALMGISSISVPSSLDAAGIPTLVANVVLLAATAFVSVLVLRRGRVSFYIPIVGAIVFSLVSLLLIDLYAPGLITQLGDAVTSTTG